MADGRFIAYYRVSTAQQGRSGLGLEGQRAAVAAFLNGGHWRLLAEFTEVESGANDARPELACGSACNFDPFRGVIGVQN
jgi:DNA invertase Pin-like site-specific DNA recombinase